MKQCTKCLKFKPESDFYLKRIQGLEKPIAVCRDCSKLRASKQRYSVKELCLNFLQQQSCSTCGYSTYIGALEFHHETSDKDFAISKIRRNYLTEEAKQELKKCSVLCTNCHRSVHHKSRALSSHKVNPQSDGKYCKKCKNMKALNDFYQSHGICKECYCALVSNKQRLRKEQCVQYKGGECQRCHNVNEPYLLDFHHMDMTLKELNISKLIGRTFQRLKTELDKCILLCGNCHREVHYLEEELVDNFKPNKETNARIEEIELQLRSNLQLSGSGKDPEKACVDCGVGVGLLALRCPSCHAISRRKFNPKRDELVNLIRTKTSLEEVARFYGVSSNAIRKRCKALYIDI